MVRGTFAVCSSHVRPVNRNKWRRAIWNAHMTYKRIRTYILLSWFFFGLSVENIGPPDYIGLYGPSCLSIFLFSIIHWIKLNGVWSISGPDNSNDSVTSNYLVNTQNWTPHNDKPLKFGKSEAARAQYVLPQCPLGHILQNWLTNVNHKLSRVRKGLSIRTSGPYSFLFHELTGQFKAIKTKNKIWPSADWPYVKGLCK